MNEELWWRSPRGQAHDAVFETVRRIEQENGDLFDRFVKLEALYDPNGPDAADAGERLDHVTENAIASGVDTVSAVISTTDVRSRVMTDGADWGQRRTARHLEWYAEQLGAELEILARARSACKESSKKGNGVVKRWVVFDEIRVEHVLIENIVVDDNECRAGRKPRQLHQWDWIDADELAAMFPGNDEAIEAARTSRRWHSADRGSQYGANMVAVLFSWRLPVGKKGTKNYVAGRYTACVDGRTLTDKKYEKDHFPFDMMVWSERVKSFYGIGGAERIAGIQRALNRRNWQIERANDQLALPTTYVRQADANLLVKSSRVGAMAVCRGEYPKTVTPVAVSGETYQSRIDLRESALNEFGVTSMQTHGTKPAGLDSGAALREFKDQTTQRFAPQERSFEDLVLDITWGVLDLCKDLGQKAPTVMRHSRFGARRIRWADVDMRDMKIQLQAASNLNRTPAGRMQTVVEYAQAGIITQDEARRLLEHPDLEGALSLYTAALEAIENDLDEIADGANVMPEPFSNLAMTVWRGQQEYLKWSVEGAPEDRLEALRQYVVQAAWMEQLRNAPQASNANMPAMGAELGAVPGAPPAGAEMPIPAGGITPPTSAPVAAFSDQAMQLRAG
jgi:hypothetical protein